MTRFDLGAFVTGAVITSSGAAFALGDGTVRFEDGRVAQAHKGAVLCAVAHPSGEGVLTGGDDGRLAWSRGDQVETLARIAGRWIDVMAVGASGGLIAFAAGREVHLRDAGDPAFARAFSHDKSVAGLAFEAKGRRLAAATYGGVALWYARIGEQKPVMLRWAGSHIAAAFSPDGRFLVSALQENALHGWRLADASDMRMGGYPTKPKSLAFLGRGAWLATSGANGVVIWPFQGPAGPMGKPAEEIGHDEASLVTVVAADPAGTRLAAGTSDGQVWACDLATRQMLRLKTDKGPVITVLAMDGAGRVAWGDEAGAAGIEAWAG